MNHFNGPIIIRLIIALIIGVAVWMTLEGLKFVGGLQVALPTALLIAVLVGLTFRRE